MPDLPTYNPNDGEPEKVDNSNAEARRTLADLDEVVALLAAEILGG